MFRSSTKSDGQPWAHKKNKHLWRTLDWIHVLWLFCAWADSGPFQRSRVLRKTNSSACVRIQNRKTGGRIGKSKEPEALLQFDLFGILGDNLWQASVSGDL